MIKALDIDGDGAKDLVIVDTEGDHPIHIRFSTDEKKLGPEQRFALEMPPRSRLGRWTARGLGDSGPRGTVGAGAGAFARSVRGRREQQAGTAGVFCLPQGNERGRSTDVGDLNGDKRKDVIVTDPANAQVWVYLQTGHSGLSSGQTFPSLGNARTVRILHGSDGKAEVYVLSEQEKQIGRSTFENGRLSFPAPVALEGDPVAMDVADLDGDKTPRDCLHRQVRLAPETRHGRRFIRAEGVSRGPDGEMKSKRWGQAASVQLAGVTAAPSAIKAVDINQDGRSDLLLFRDYGAPTLVLSEKDGPPRIFAASLGPLSRWRRRA